MWLVRVFLILIAFHLSLNTSTAQSFTQRLQTGNTPGKVTIHQDAAIDALVNGKITMPNQQQNAGNNQQQNRRQNNGSHNDQQNRTNRNEQANQAQNNGNKAVADSTAVATTSRYHYVKGWRVQVFNGGATRSDLQKAEQIANSLRSLYPEHRVYVKYDGTRRTCRIGDFVSKEEAFNMYRELKKMYDTASIVEGKVIVSY